MTEQKKKQVSIAAFFSPQPARKRPAASDKAGDGAASAATPPTQAQASADAAKPGKRPRVSPSSAAVTPADAAITVTPPVGKPAASAGSASSAAHRAGKRSKAGAVGKQPKAKQPKAKKPRTPKKTRAKGKVLFTSPHELGDEDDDLDEDAEAAPAAAVAVPVEDASKTEDARDEQEVGDEQDVGDEQEPIEIELTPIKSPKAADTTDEKPAPASGVDDDGETAESGEDTPLAPSSEQAIDLTASPARPQTTKATPKQAAVVQDLTEDVTEVSGSAAGVPAKRPRGRPRGSSAAAKAPKRSAGRATANGKPQSNGAGESKPVVDAVAATSPEVRAALDPVVQARVDTYQLKLQDLTRTCAELLTPSDRAAASSSEDSAQDAQRALLQDVYGVGLDIELDVSTDDKAMAAAISDVWSKWSADEAGESPVAAGGASELPHAVKAFIAKHIQGRSASLSSLCDELVAKLQSVAASGDTKADEASTKRVAARAALAIDMEIKMLAQRTPYGAKPPPRANLFEDTTPEALWVWEMGNPERFYPDEAHKTLKRVRKHRKRVWQQVKSLVRVVKLLHQSPVDEAKVSAEEAKVGKFVLAVEAELSRSRDRERKELERALVTEVKKRADEEKKHAREEEKKQRQEAERELATKRKKSLVSYFRSIDTEAAPASAAAAPAAGGPNAEPTASTASAAGEGLAGRVASQPIEVENASETIERMDAAILFLRRDAGASAAVALAELTYPWKEARAARRMVTRGSAQSWTSKRRRDAKRGVMKLLQFHENTRPAYFGTFGERCGLLRGGRRPLARYPKFDYSVDSDDEWEEEEPGESLSDADSDNGDDSDDDNLDYGDDWLAYEDEVEYMDGADGEDGEDEDEDGPSADDDLGSPQRHRKRKLPSQLEQKRRKKMAKLTRLEPKVAGPFWCQSAACDAHFGGAMTGQLLVVAAVVAFESPLMRRAREHELLEAEKQRKKAEELARKAQQQADKLAAEEADKEKSKAPTSVKEKAKAKGATPAKERAKSKAATPIKPRKTPVAAAAAPAPTVMNSPAKAEATPATSPPGIAAWLQPQPKASAVAASAPTTETSGATAADAAAVAADEGEDSSDVEMVAVDEEDS